MNRPDDPSQPSPGFDAVRPGGEMKARGPEAPTPSQLLPIGAGQWQELLSKPYFLPGLVACIVVPLLFTLLQSSSANVQVQLYGGIPVNVPVYTIVLALCITAGGAFAVYRMAGKPKALWLMPAVAVFTGLVVRTPVMGMLQSLFGGGNLADESESLPVALVKAYFAAGFPEEIVKSIPVFIGVFIGWQLMSRRELPGPARQLAVLDPLDGILIGAASGFGFAFVETIFLYVPRTVLVSRETVSGLVVVLQHLGAPVQMPQIPPGASPLPWIVKLYVALANGIGVDRAAFELNQILAHRQGIGLQLMIPRLLSDVFGHAAYAGLFGYFIGLAALKPVARVKTVLIGLLVAATIHAMWDAMAGSVFTTFLLAFLAFVALAVAIMKARTIAPDRSQLVASQIIDRFAGRSAPARSATFEAARRPVQSAAPEQAPVAVQRSQETFAAGERPGRLPSAAKYAPPPAPLLPSITWDDDSNLRVIEVGTARVPASVGARLYERHVPGSHALAGDGVIGVVSANPNDPNVLGLKNLTDAPWPLKTASGQQRELLPGRSIRLEAGLEIRIGETLAHVR